MRGLAFRIVGAVASGFWDVSFGVQDLGLWVSFGWKRLAEGQGTHEV